MALVVVRAAELDTRSELAVAAAECFELVAVAAAAV